MQTTSLAIDGMSCGHCVAHVRKALAAIPGVQVGDVDIGSATIQHAAGVASADDIAKAVRSAGYTVRSQHTTAGDDA